MGERERTHRALGVAAAGFCTFVNLYATQSVLSVLAQDFGVARPRTGLTVTAPLLAVALVAPFVGSVSDRFGRKRLIIGAACLLVVPTLLCATADSLTALLLWRFLQGLLLPFIFAVTVAYIADECEGAEAVRLTGIYVSGTILGGFAGRFLSGYATQWAGWRAAFLLLGGLTAVFAAAIVLLLPKECRFRPEHGFASVLRSFAEHLSNPRLIATYTVGFTVLFSIVATFTFVNFLLAAPPYDFGPAQLGNVFVVYLASVVTTPIATRLTLRLGRRPMLALSVGLAVGGLLLTLLRPFACIMAGLALLMCGAFFEQALAMGYIGVAARRARSTAVGLYVSCYYIGGSLGGILPAPLWQRSGWSGCVLLVVLVQLALSALALCFWKEARPGPA